MQERTETKYRIDKCVEKILFALPSVFSILFIILPLSIIFYVSLCKATISSPPYTNIVDITDSSTVKITLNFGNYKKIICDPYYILSSLNSIFLSVIVTIFTVVIGLSMAYGLYKMQRVRKKIFVTLIYISFWTSFLIRIYAWMSLLGKNGTINNLLMAGGIIKHPIQFIGNIYTTYFGMIICYLPFVILPIHSRLETIDKIYIEASYDLGYTPTKTFWKVIIPLLRNAIITSCFFVFSMSIGEFAIPELLGDSSVLTFGKVLWNEFFTNLDWPMACSISIFVIVFILLPVYLLQNKMKHKE